jgi:hypothetical protein
VRIAEECMKQFLTLVGCLLPLVIPPSCMGRRVMHVIPEGALRTQYVIDYDYRVDQETLHASMGHLLVFNPGDAVAELAITAYFEDRDPLTLTRAARGGATTEFNAAGLGLPLNNRFALRVRSSQPVICQGTEGWTNTGNEYDTSAVTKSPRGPRETAKSTMGISELARRWFVADGYVLLTHGRHWVRESEWALVLNPGERPAHVRLDLAQRATRRTHEVTISQRLAAIFMDEVAAHNEHYGTEFNSDEPVAVQWRREVYWTDSDEIMAFWSVPAVPLSEPPAMVESAR